MLPLSVWRLCARVNFSGTVNTEPLSSDLSVSLFMFIQLLPHNTLDALHLFPVTCVIFFPIHETQKEMLEGRMTDLGSKNHHPLYL